MAFFGLDVASRGLLASRNALNVVNQNITNSTTKGYSRKVATIRASNPAPASGAGMLGTGSELVSVDRIRDDYLDTKVWGEQSVTTEWSNKSEYLQQISDIMCGTDVLNAGDAVNEFFTAYSKYAKDPTDTNRVVFLQAGEDFVNSFKSMANDLEELQNTLNIELKSQVNEINSLADRIARMNKEIYDLEVRGQDANTLRDERALLIEELSQFADIKYEERNCGKLQNGKDDIRVSISIGGMTLVNHFDTAKLELVERGAKTNPEDIDGLYDIKWETGNIFNVKSGSLKAILDVRDGTGDSIDNFTKGVPYYTKQINEFAKTFVKAFNEGIKGNDTTAANKSMGHADGYVSNSKAGDDLPHIRFFTMDNMSSAEFAVDADGNPIDETDLEARNALYDNITAKNLSLSKDVVESIGNIFSTKNIGDIDDTGTLYDLISFREDKTMFEQGNVEDVISSWISTIGSQVKNSEKLQENHEATLQQLQNNRDAYSGVSLSEEMTEMLKYQQLYQSCAKMINVMSGIYDTLINAI